MLVFFSFSFTDKGVQDHEEPDLTAYAAIDMSTLQDVHCTGMDYILSLEALMHPTPGLKPGYLPERNAHYLLSGVRVAQFIILPFNFCLLDPSSFLRPFLLYFQALNMLTVTSYMDERSA